MSVRPRSVPRAAVWRRPWWAALVLLAGCSGQRDLLSDPFLGTPVPSRAADNNALAAAPAASSPAAAANPTAPPAGGVPPLPNTHTMTSPAALVSGPTPATSANSGHDMRIGDAAGAGTTASSAAGAALHGPEPSGSADRSTAGTPGWPTTPYQLTSTAGPSTAAAAGSDSFDHLMDELHKRGVEDFWRLEYLGGGVYHFRCMMPNPDNRNLGRNYEVRVPGANGLAAIRAVIDQIDHDRAGK